MNRDTQAMDCERYDKIALNLLYEELDELTAASARRHLHHCTRCKNISSGMHATRELAALPLVDPPAGLQERILQAERFAHKELSLRERLGRAISITAGYAMRPQLAMAALLLLMVASSLVFLRARPAGHDQVSVTERGVPGLDAEPLPRHVIVTEPIPTDSIPPPPSSKVEAVAAAPKKGSVDKEDSDFPGSQRSREEEASRSEPAGLPDFDQALAAYHGGRYAEAEQMFARIAAAGESQAPRVALHEAHSARNGSGCPRAAALYDGVATRYAGTPTADEASWHAASCYRAMGQPERAAAHYRHLASRPGYADRATQALAAIEGRNEPKQDAPAVAARKASSAPSTTSSNRTAPAAAAGAAAPAEPEAAPPSAESKSADSD